MLAFALLSFFASSQNANIASESKTQVQGEVTVYYFHVERRCETCLTVERVARKAVAELYNGKVKYKVLNLDKETGKAKAKELKVPAQALVIVKGEEKIDITADCFRYAKKNPDKVKAIIKENTDPLLK